MQLAHAVSLAEIAALVGARIVQGIPDLPVTGLNEIHKVTPGDLTFVDHPKYYDKALNSAATTVLANAELSAPEGKAVLFSTDPFRDYNALVKHFGAHRPAQATDVPTNIPASCLLGPGAYVGPGVQLGEKVIIGPNVVIMGPAIIGNHVVIGPNTTIGHEAFYYKRRPEGWDKLISCGQVIIEDRVEIGANCTIDKGVSGDTIVGSGTKLDNMIHLGHGVVVGKNCLFAAQVAIGGKTIIEDDVVLWGKVGVQKDITIGKGAVVLACSCVSKSLKGGKTYFGSPAKEATLAYKEAATLSLLTRGK